MDATPNRRGSWFGVASCAIAVVAIVGVVKTTTFHFEGLWSDEHRSLNAGLTSDLDEWVWALFGALVAGAALGIAALRRAGERRWIAWTGVALNGLLLVVMAVFVALAYSQGAFR